MGDPVECKGLGRKLLNWCNAVVTPCLDLHPYPQAKSDYLNNFPQFSVGILFFRCLIHRIAEGVRLEGTTLGPLV